ncbi:MAG: undecaprenyldiphospho-muramoylpentapeptide beta-N-acetylglucosaminyltransferase [Akkermansia sp.]|nr:undecaprenyldiphospho-muramoylpentapeptide beta-N-acetylglucosaminyltransferase [Akkermansia sp.]
MTTRPLNIVIACGGTGGHLFPGIAVAQQLRKQGHRPILLISRKEVDAEASSKYGDLEFHSIPAIAKPPTLSLRMPAFLWKLFTTYTSCKKLLRQEKADVVLGMGGFTSLPPCKAAHALGLRSYVHDSNAMPGKSNRLTARWCTKVLVGMKEAVQHFPGSSCAVVGTPVRDEIRNLPTAAEARQRLGLPQGKPVILVTGGSQGARNLNSLLIEAAKADPEVHYLVIAGRIDYERVNDLAGGAPNITVLGFCADMPAAYAAADGVIARSGASTLTELSIIGKACLLVPYPFAADDHQTHNARAFSDHGAAVLIQQADLTVQKVHDFVHATALNPEARTAMENAMRALARPDAAVDIARTILGE